MTKTILTIGACATLLGAGMAQAAAPPEAKCQAERAKAAGAYASCQQQAGAKIYSAFSITSGYADKDVVKFEAAVSKCRVKYTDTWAKLQAKAPLAGSSCTAARFVDNGTTATDNLTGLQWEKKTNDT